MEFLPSVPLPVRGQAVREATAGSHTDTPDAPTADFDALIDGADPVLAQLGSSTTSVAADLPEMALSETVPDLDPAITESEDDALERAVTLVPDMALEPAETPDPVHLPDDHANARAFEVAALAPHDRGRGPVRAAAAAARHIESVISRWNGLSAHLSDPATSPDAAQVDEILRRAGAMPGAAPGHRMIMDIDLPAEAASEPEPQVDDLATGAIVTPAAVDSSEVAVAVATAAPDPTPAARTNAPETMRPARENLPATPPGLPKADESALAAIAAAPGRASERLSLAPAAAPLTPAADVAAKERAPAVPAMPRVEPPVEPRPTSAAPVAAPAVAAAAPATPGMPDAPARANAASGTPVPLETFVPVQATPNPPPRSNPRTERAVERTADRGQGLEAAAPLTAPRNPYAITPPPATTSFAAVATPTSPQNTPGIVETEENAGLPADVRLDSAMPRDPFAPRAEPFGQSQTARGPEPHMPAVGRQIAAAAVRIGREEVELTLAPEELGKLRLRVARGEHHAVVTVWFEKPEVLDAARRHLDQLMQDLHDSGLENATLDLRGEAGGQRERPTEGLGNRDPLGEIGEADGPITLAAAIGPRGPSRLSDRQLDIRV